MNIPNPADLMRSTLNEFRSYQPPTVDQAWKLDLMDRIARVLPKVVLPLRDYSSGLFVSFLSKERRTEMEEGQAKLAEDVTALTRAVKDALHSQDLASVRFIEIKFRTVERQATDLVTLLSAETEDRSSVSALSLHMQQHSSDPVAFELARSAALKGMAALTRVANGAIAGRTLMRRLLSREWGSDRPNEKTNAARLRRQRERRRKGVAYRLSVDVYANELELLRQMGFLAGRDKDDKTAVEAALEAFLLAAFKSYPDDMTWMSRHRLLMDRSIAEKDDSDL